MGGMETYCVELVRELEYRHQVTLSALPGRDDGGAPTGLALIGFGLKNAWRLLMHGGGYDVIHGGDMAVWPLVFMARLRSGRAGVALSAHGTDVAYAGRPGFLPKLYRLYMRVGARALRGARVLANSRATAERARTLGFCSIEVIPLATRVPDASLPNCSGRFILFAGRLVRRKGLSWFVEKVLPHLPEDIVLKVAGTVWDESERAALSAPRVEFLGPVDWNELAGLMTGALCVVIPNVHAGPGHFEGFGLVAVEAAAVGGVVLAAEIDGFLDSVLDGETGELLPAGSAPEWIAAIDRVASWSPNKRTEVVDRRRSAARVHFAWERVARETEAVYMALSA